MTTVVAVETESKVTFASDSRISGDTLHDGWLNKVVTNGPLTFGAAGYLRTIQILQYAKLPEPPKSDDPDAIDRFVTKELVEAVKDAFKEVSSDANEYSHILTAVRGRVYRIGVDGAWIRNPDGYYAVGSGSHFALGALKAGATAKKAVEIASFYDGYTNDDIRVMKVKR